MIKLKKRIITDAKDKPIAVLLDYEDYKRLKEIEEDARDYEEAVSERKKANGANKWHSMDAVLKKAGIK
jgi:hypothetical protein